MLVSMLADFGGWWNTYAWHPLEGLGYQWWSGVGSDIGELAIIGAVAGAYRKAECHQEGCHRLGRFPHGHYKLCHVHHPHVPSDGKINREAIDKMTKRKEEGTA